MVKVPTKDSQVVVRSIIEVLKDYPKGLVKKYHVTTGHSLHTIRYLMKCWAVKFIPIKDTKKG